MSLPMVATYPLAKRYTKYPQVVLGLTFNWGALLGWQAMHANAMTLVDNWHVVAPLYAAAISWTLIYDTIYAHQDARDDERHAKISSTALTFGDRTKPITHAFNLAMLMLLGVSGCNNEQSVAYFASVLAASLYTNRIIRRVDLQDA